MRHILFLVLAAFTLAACTQDELAEQGTALPEGAYPITIASVQVAEALPQTRVTETSDGMGSTWNERNPDMVIVKVTGGGNDAESICGGIQRKLHLSTLGIPILKAQIRHLICMP